MCATLEDIPHQRVLLPRILSNSVEGTPPQILNVSFLNNIFLCCINKKKCSTKTRNIMQSSYSELLCSGILFTENFLNSGICNKVLSTICYHLPFFTSYLTGLTLPEQFITNRRLLPKEKSANYFNFSGT
ncbi:unnamed protein product [Orchesella dallaii]|uniref:Uncharacterized protein n=1 Tax=Orchesella dallaii TaxID=48710 RepID=A0ABP1QYL1_9HEXA